MSTALGWNLITTLATPAAPAAIEYVSTDINGVTRSTFTYGEQLYVWVMAYWQWRITMPMMPEPVAEPWIGFMLALQGAYNVCQLGDPRRRTPIGAWGGTPVVNGADQLGFLLSLSGLAPSQPVSIAAGDYIQIGFRLYRATVSAPSNSSGDVTVPIWPNLRESPANGAVVVYQNTQGLFRLKANTRNWRLNTQRFYELSYDLIEVINQAPA